MILGRVDRKEGGREMGRGRLGCGDGEGCNREGEGEVEKSWQGPGVGRRGGGRESGQEGVGWGGGDRRGAMGRRLGSGNLKGEMGRGHREGGDRRGGGGKVEGEKKGQEDRWI